jgi:uncharacterized protein YjiK
MIKYFLTLVVILLCSAQALRAQKDMRLPYDLDQPHEVHELPEVLEEISGLTYFDKNTLAAVNDEHGRVYLYDLINQQLKKGKNIKFAGKGDFEGIELVGDYVYAIKSNGDLYRFSTKMYEVVEKIKSPFKAENDIEGLGYNHITHQLIIALKGEGDTKGVEVKGKAVYAFDLAEQKHKKMPVYVLNDKDLKRVLGSKNTKVRPSGIAVHPITHEVYMIASVGHALIIFHQDGRPKSFTPLKRNLFPQPEGITFSPEGDLFISNEREGEGGTILHFKMNQKD